MLRLFWFLIKIGLLVAGAMWIASRPGQIELKWMEYEIIIHFGFFLLIFFVLLLLTVGLTRLALYITGFSTRRKYKKIQKNTEKGLQALTLSLSSTAAGDYGQAQFQAKRALKLLPGEQPIPLLLEANAQRQQGNYEHSNETLKNLLSHPEGAVLAARALIGSAIDQDNLAGALAYARTAHRDYKGKDRAWLLKTLYELEAKAGHWDEALKFLGEAYKQQEISKEQADRDSVAIMTEHARELSRQGEESAAQALFKTTLKKNPAFPPAVSGLFDLLLEQGKKRAAANLIKTAWQHTPHPQFVTFWKKIGLNYGKDEHDLKWLAKLTRYYPGHIESHYAHATFALLKNDLESAREHIERAASIDPQRRIYKLWAELAEKQGQSEASIRHRFEQMAETKMDCTWICTQTGLTYDRWYAIARPHGSFNTIIWESPDKVRKSANINKVDRTLEMITTSSTAS